MSGLILNSVTEREKFDIARMALQSANRDVPGFNVNAFKLTQGFLRLEALSVVGTTQFRFNLLVNQAPLTNNEQRLNLQDSFIMSSLGITIAKKTSATDSKFIPLTYPDPLELTNAAEYMGLYNGSLQVSVNNNVLIPAWEVLQHYNAPITQAQAGPPVQVNSSKLISDSFIPVEPNIVLVGTKNNEIVLNLKEPFTTVDSNTYIQLNIRGILAQNSTNVA